MCYVGSGSSRIWKGILNFVSWAVTSGPTCPDEALIYRGDSAEIKYASVEQLVMILQLEMLENRMNWFCADHVPQSRKKKLPSMKKGWKIRSTKSHFTDQCDCLSFLPCTKGSRVNLSGQQCFAPGCFPFFSNLLAAGHTYGRINAGLYHSFHFFFSLCARNGTRFFQSGWASLTATRCKMWTALLAWSRSTELHHFWFEALIRRSYWMRALYVRISSASWVRYLSCVAVLFIITYECCCYVSRCCSMQLTKWIWLFRWLMVVRASSSLRQSLFLFQLNLWSAGEVMTLSWG